MSKSPVVSVVMGSDSDLRIMQKASDILAELGISHEVDIVSAHRTPNKLYDYARTARERKLKAIIAGAGGAAHLPGMIASMTTLPVIGVPILSSNSIQGWDSILSILQMPGGVPVATVALDGAKNAALLAASIVANDDDEVEARLMEYKKVMEETVLEKSKNVKKVL